MPIYKGNTPIVGIYKGSTEIVRRYRGADLIYESAKWLPYSFSPFILTTLPQTIDGLNVRDAQKITSLKGNSVAWNQLCADNFGASTSYWARNRVTQTNNNNIATFVSNSNAYNQVSFYHPFPAGQLTKGNKYLVRIKVRLTSGLCSDFRLYMQNDLTIVRNPQLNVWYDLSFIWTNTRENNQTVNGLVTQRTYSSVDDIVVNSDSFEAKEPQLFDLTLMFNAGSEPTSVLEFNRLFPNAYYAYDAGRLRSSQASALKATGYNQSSVDRTQGTLVGGDYSSNNAQNFSEGEYYLGISANDYINRNPVSNFSKTETSVTFTTSVTSYGVALPVRVIAGQTYNLEMTISDGMAYRYISWYDESGRFISYISGTDATQYTAPSNAYWGVILLRPSSSSASVAVTYSNICLHLTGKTGYEPYWSETYQLPNIVLRSTPSVRDELFPDGIVTRRVGIRAYQSGDENDVTVITDKTNTYYALATPTTEQSTAFQEQTRIDPYGTMEMTTDIPQGMDSKLKCK